MSLRRRGRSARTAVPQPARVAVARWCATHPWVVIALWLLLLVAGGLGSKTLSAGFDDSIELPGAQSVAGLDAIAGSSGQPATGSGTVVLHSDDGPLEADAASVAAVLAEVEALDQVRQASDPLTTPGALSADARTGLVTVEFTSPYRELETAAINEVEEAFAALSADGVQVEFAGQLGESIESAEAHRTPEAIGLVAALIVLLLVFGSVLASLLPLLAAVTAVAVGLLALSTMTAIVSFASVSPTLATMIGLGTGIDYALFYVTRHRQLLIDGVDPVRAASATARTTGHAVVVGAATVALALLGLYASGITFVGNLGLAAVLTVATSALGALTLVPAALGLTARRIDRWRVRRPVAEPTGTGGGWAAHARRVSRRPWPFLLGGAALLTIFAAPVLALDTGPVDDGAAASSTTTRRAFDLITDGFGVGRNGTLTAVVSADGLDPTEVGAATEEVRDTIAGTEGVASASPFVPAGSGEYWTSVIQPASAPQDQATEDLFVDLRDHILPAAADTAGVGESVYVTGQLAAQLEFGREVVDRLPLIMGVVVGAAFLLLVWTFRSVVIAAKAAVLNVLSIGAAYGVMVAVFQWQWGSGLLGVHGPVPIESYAPMIMFVVVFGLSMDYEVFLLSRVREVWLRTGDTTSAVADGLSATARVISAAALIMVSVFLGFTLDDDVTIKMLALGLAVSVVIDATIVRLVLVPAAMAAMGSANWWLPSWLERLLPGSSPAPAGPPPMMNTAAPQRVGRGTS